MRYSRHIVILIVVTFLVFSLAELPGGRVAPAMEKGEGPADDAMILVEAFMVEAPLSELYELGLPPVSTGTKSVSAEQILACLKKPKTGAVTAGAKLAIGQGAEATTETITQWGYYAGPPQEQDMQFIDHGLSLTAQAAVTPGGKVSISLEFKHGSLDEDDEYSDALPVITNRNWACRAVFKPGKPMLVGATQDEETATFLLVTANIIK